MSIKDKSSLKTDNDQLYDDAITLTQEVTATLQKVVTNDQVDSFTTLKDRIITVNVSVAPTAIILDFSNNEQFILDLTTQPATKIFDVTSILGIESGQNNRIEVIKNSDQSITLTPASGPVISEPGNKLQITGIGSPVSFVYSYLDDSNVTSASLGFLEVFVDSVGGDDNNDGSTQANAVKTDDRVYTIVENSNIFNVFITRKRGGTYTIVNDHNIRERSLTFLTFDAGAAPIVSSAGGEITISGLFAMFDETLSSDASSSYFFVINSLKVNLFGGKLVADQSVIFTGGNGKILSFFINPTVDISGVTIATITDMPVRAVDVVGSTSLISGFTDNALSTVLNVTDGLNPIIDITFEGEDTPFGTTSPAVKLIEKGMDKGTWTLTHNSIVTEGIENINLLDETSIGSSVPDIWINSLGTIMVTLGFGGTSFVQLFNITNGDVSTKVEDVGNFKDLTAFGITQASNLHLSQAGDKLVIADRGTGNVYGLDISTNFVLSSITAIASTFDPGSQAGSKENFPLGIWLPNDGLTLMLTGLSEKVIQYVLPSAFDLTGAGVSFSTEFVLGGIPSGVHLSPDSFTMYIWDYDQGRLRQFNLPKPNRVEFAIETQLEVLVSGGTPSEDAGIHLNDAQNKMYIVNKSPNVVQQFNFNGTRTYELRKNGGAFADDPVSKYSIRGHLVDEHKFREVSGISIDRTPVETTITVQNGAGLQKDFSIQIYKNT